MTAFDFDYSVLLAYCGDKEGLEETRRIATSRVSFRRTI